MVAPVWGPTPSVQAQELNDQIMMMTPGSPPLVMWHSERGPMCPCQGSLDGAFGFDSPALHKNSVSLVAGQAVNSTES